MTKNIWINTRSWSSEPCCLRPVACPDGITRLIYTPKSTWWHAEILLQKGIWKNRQIEINCAYDRAIRDKPADCDLTNALEIAWIGRVARYYDLYTEGKKIPLRFQDLCTD